MEFKDFNKKIKSQFERMCKNKLFRVDISGDDLWNVYLSSFENSLIFRDPESNENNCNLCKHFIRRYGNIVSLDENGNTESMFSNINDVGEYTNPTKELDKIIKSKNIKDIFFETYYNLKVNKTQNSFKLGIEENKKIYTKEEAEKFGKVEPDVVYKFNHFSVDLPSKFVNFTGNSIESIIAKYRDNYNVFKRAMEEISLDTLKLVKDLINQGSLLDGNTHIHSVQEIIIEKEIYDKFNGNTDLYCWYRITEIDERTAKFKNTLIGVLCTELTEGEELNKACENWNKRVDPINYHKAKSPITKRQIEEAKKFVIDNDYGKSFDRRFATIDDIKASEIKHINSGDGKIEEVSIFDNVKSTSTQHKRSNFDKVEEVSIDKFIKDILPNCNKIEAYLENRMQSNLVTITTSKDENSKKIFKWDNNYSWTYNGNIAGISQIKQSVKERGGNTEGVLNIRLAFPSTTDDYDLHLLEPDGYEIYFRNVRRESPLGGMLDLDAQGVDGHQEPDKRVENIIYKNKDKMIDGNYIVFVRNYSCNGLKSLFTIEIEFNDEIITLNQKSTSSNEIGIGKIELNNGIFKFIPNDKVEIIESKHISKTIWNLETNNFHKVNLVCLSPNHWSKNKVGNLHYFFMLDNCKTDTDIRSFHNENLIPELLKHRKVMEVLGSTNMIKPSDKQLSGIGFNSTVKDELIVKCSGNFKRLLKIKF